MIIFSTLSENKLNCRINLLIFNLLKTIPVAQKKIRIFFK
jgi:hypothetical protein